MIAATLHGPNYFAANYDAEDIEVFANIGTAIEAVFDRYAANGAIACEVHTLDGHSNATQFPVFGEGHYIECYELSEPADDEDGAEHYILEGLTAVHSGICDWRIELVRCDDGIIRVQVTNTGVQ